MFIPAVYEASYNEAQKLQAQGVRVVLDLCDNHFYNPGDAPELTRAGVELRRMLRLADQLVLDRRQRLLR